MEIKGSILVSLYHFKLLKYNFYCNNNQSFLKSRFKFIYFSNGKISDESMSVLLVESNMAESKSSIFIVDEDLCYGCGACIALCPTNALDLVNRLAIVNQDDCTLCNHCIPSCPVFALSIVGVNL